LVALALRVCEAGRFFAEADGVTTFSGVFFVGVGFFTAAFGEGALFFAGVLDLERERERDAALLLLVLAGFGFVAGDLVTSSSTSDPEEDSISSSISDSADHSPSGSRDISSESSRLESSVRLRRRAFLGDDDLDLAAAGFLAVLFLGTNSTPRSSARHQLSSPTVDV